MRVTNLLPSLLLSGTFFCSATASPFDETDAQEMGINLMCVESADWTPYLDKPIVDLRLWKSDVRDIAPLKNLPIRTVTIFGCPIEDISALSAMPLEKVWIGATRVTDFSPLHSKTLQHLNLYGSNVSDIHFLTGMTQLKTLQLPQAQAGRISDLTPLKGMQLESLEFDAHTVSKGLDIVRNMQSLKKINDLIPEQFWQQYQKDLPILERLRKAKVNFRSLSINEDGTWWLSCHEDDIPQLSNLEGLPIKSLELYDIPNRDLTPLKKLNQLTTLSLSSEFVEDLTPLSELNITSLYISCPLVTDLSPLKSLSLESLTIKLTEPIDLSPLQESPLTSLNIKSTAPIDLSPLQGAPLKNLWLTNARVAKLNTLAKAPLEYLYFNTETPPLGVEALLVLPSLKQVNNRDASSFRQAYAAGERASLNLPQWMYGWE